MVICIYYSPFTLITLVHVLSTGMFCYIVPVQHSASDNFIDTVFIYLYKLVPCFHFVSWLNGDLVAFCPFSIEAWLGWAGAMSCHVLGPFNIEPFYYLGALPHLGVLSKCWALFLVNGKFLILLSASLWLESNVSPLFASVLHS